MTRNGQSTSVAKSRSDGRAPASELDALADAVRAAIGRRGDWQETARLVTAALARGLPSPDILTETQQIGDPEGYRSYVLHTEPDGSFSIVALVWRPGQMTPIHDHVTWCVFGVVQGIEHEELFRLDEADECLVGAGSSTNHAGDITGFAPPGDIHRVRNIGDSTAISIHVYGTRVAGRLERAAVLRPSCAAQLGELGGQAEAGEALRSHERGDLLDPGAFEGDHVER